MIHYAAKNELCPDVRIGKLKEKKLEPRAMRKEDAARLIAAADGDVRPLQPERITYPPTLREQEDEHAITSRRPMTG